MLPPPPPQSSSPFHYLHFKKAEVFWLTTSASGLSILLMATITGTENKAKHKQWEHFDKYFHHYTFFLNLFGNWIFTISPIIIDYLWHPISLCSFHHTHTHTHTHTPSHMHTHTHTHTHTTNTCITGVGLVEWEERKLQISLQKRRGWFSVLKRMWGAKAKCLLC